ncbi:hypothetical protein B0T17DRAFT_190876 [Bombardia bombarda]|uniref:Uncharacterized protein n=1 Tax=Bombardia bombarda TaxID=252184 RepID=A0AA39X9W4_9PEZI|nr:hypothetical protein B0T17DRAFT_190876 [Bombardia bombarda]
MGSVIISHNTSTTAITAPFTGTQPRRPKYSRLRRYHPPGVCFSAMGTFAPKLFISSRNSRGSGHRTLGLEHNMPLKITCH